MESERILPELPTESSKSCGSQNQGGGSSTSNQHEHDKLPQPIPPAYAQRRKSRGESAECDVTGGDGRKIAGSKTAAGLRAATSGLESDTGIAIGCNAPGAVERGRVRPDERERSDTRGTAECGQMQQERLEAGNRDELIGMGIISREDCGVRANFAGTPNRIVGIMRLAKSGRREFNIKSTRTR